MDNSSLREELLDVDAPLKPEPSGPAATAYFTALILLYAYTDLEPIRVMFYNDLSDVGLLQNLADHGALPSHHGFVGISWAGHSPRLLENMTRIRELDKQRLYNPDAELRRQADVQHRQELQRFKHFYGADPRGLAILGGLRTPARVVPFGFSREEPEFKELAEHRRTLASLSYITGDFKGDIARHRTQLQLVGQAIRRYEDPVLQEVARSLQSWAKETVGAPPSLPPFGPPEASRQAILVFPSSELWIGKALRYYLEDRVEISWIKGDGPRPLDPTEFALGLAAAEAGMDLDPEDFSGEKDASNRSSLGRQDILRSIIELRLLSYRWPALVEEVPDSDHREFRLTPEARRHLPVKLRRGGNMIQELERLKRLYELVQPSPGYPNGPDTLEIPTTRKDRFIAAVRARGLYSAPSSRPV